MSLPGGLVMACMALREAAPPPGGLLTDALLRRRQVERVPSLGRQWRGRDRDPEPAPAPQCDDRRHVARGRPARPTRDSSERSPPGRRLSLAARPGIVSVAEV